MPVTQARLRILGIVAWAFVVAPIACAKTAATDGTATEACPKDLLAARGSACRTDGKTCGTDAPNFTHFLMCSRGKWTEMNAPPPPVPVPVPAPS